VLKYKNDVKKQALFSLIGKRIPEISSGAKGDSPVGP
jgi:hypothetical protein